MEKKLSVAAGSEPQEVAPESYRFLQQLLYARSGLVLEPGKDYLVSARLGPLARELGLGTVNDLCALLEATRRPDLTRRVVEAMTTNETSFFRDPAQFEAIRKELLPRLRGRRAALRRLRFWSAAASTGQEAYSLAMVLLEEGLADWDAEILATDINRQVLERARSGRFTQLEVNRGLPAPMLVRYFRRIGLDWQISEEARRLVRFEEFDLRSSMRTLGPFDAVLCRNVLIYFDADTKQRVLTELRRTLMPDGWLLLGGAEMLWGNEALFERVRSNAPAIYRPAGEQENC